MTAKQSMTAGNMPLAQKRPAERLREVRLDERGRRRPRCCWRRSTTISGKFQDGIAVLQKVASSSAASGVQSTILSLEGDGYAQMKKLAEAGKAYEDAAERDVVRDRAGVPTGQGGAGVRGWRRHGKGQGDLDESAERSERPDDGGRSASSARRAERDAGEAVAGRRRSRPSGRAIEATVVRTAVEQLRRHSVGAFLSCMFGWFV